MDPEILRPLKRRIIMDKQLTNLSAFSSGSRHHLHSRARIRSATEATTVTGPLPGDGDMVWRPGPHDARSTLLWELETASARRGQCPSSENSTRSGCSGAFRGARVVPVRGVSSKRKSMEQPAGGALAYNTRHRSALYCKCRYQVVLDCVYFASFHSSHARQVIR